MTTPSGPPRAFEPLTIDDRIGRFLEDAGIDATSARLEPLTGDASDRRYVRVHLARGGTLVLAIHPSPIDFQTLPFAIVSTLLEEMGLPVPAIRGHSDALGVIGLEDLGDVTLQLSLSTASAEQRIARYAQAVDLVVLLQQRGAEMRDDRALPYQLAFDVEKLTWELNFFVEHFLVGYRGATLTDEERRAFDREWAALTSELASEPRVLCHRDYHSRNLMVHEGRLVVIDFQDARLGPDTYDLASLLRDSYVELADAEVEALLERFIAARHPRADRTEFRRRFDVMAVQRNLKALGTFGYQTTSRRNPAYVESMPRTIGYLRTTLRKYAHFARLHELLGAHVPGLR